ncbi:NAD-dependent epimerase/dehydratase family protein [Cobetia sp. MMG027]|uniref:NAD-dependent epimerase/dehydratase family protein n=1 Tax=Cobetia sp. MMG027 TaxID=3021980 RepID=UPI003FA4A5E0
MPLNDNTLAALAHLDRSHPVLVTGATGYVAGQLIRRLLQEDLTVHAAVRDPGNTERPGGTEGTGRQHIGQAARLRQ